MGSSRYYTLAHSVYESRQVTKRTPPKRGKGEVLIMTIYEVIESELQQATQKFGAFNSAHEGYAVLLEEVEELWDEIKRNNGGGSAGAAEAVQIAAMAVRYLRDICGVEDD